jgi:hypothetical protein
VRTVHSSSDFPTSSPSASVRPPSMRYLTTTRMPRGAFERKCLGAGPHRGFVRLSLRLKIFSPSLSWFLSIDL